MVGTFRPISEIEIERETDGRWIAEVAVIPGAMAYGSTRTEAVDRMMALTFRILADRIAHQEESLRRLLNCSCKGLSFNAFKRAR
jgi:predicted RNase H-like HicB family nuclease